MKRFFKWAGATLLILAVVGLAAYLLRSDPWGPIAGKRLSGTEAPWPASWDALKDIPLAAVEVRPDDPHSVTTLWFVHDGHLYVPASEGSTKQWTKMALADPRVRVKIGENIYLGRALRDTSPAETFFESLLEKYPQLAEQADEGAPEDLWFFRIEPRAPAR